MAFKKTIVDLTGMGDPQRPVAVAVGAVLILVGALGLTGIADMNVVGEGLVLGVFGVPLWLGLTAVVAGLLGVFLATFDGGATTFDKVAAGLVLPAVFLLSITDWALATGGIPALAVGVGALLLAVVIAAVGTFLLRWNVLMVVFPVVAALALLDWGLGLTVMVPGEPVNLPTLGLLLVVELLVAVIAFEGGRRQTGRGL